MITPIPQLSPRMAELPTAGQDACRKLNVTLLADRTFNLAPLFYFATPGLAEDRDALLPTRPLIFWLSVLAARYCATV